MDILQERYHQDATTQAEKLRINTKIATAAQSDATSEIDLKMFMEETSVMTTDLA
jgi:hypothetical protein